MSPDFKAWREEIKNYYIENNIYNPIIFFKWNFPIVGYLENTSFEKFVNHNFSQIEGFLYDYVDWACPALTPDVIDIIEEIELRHIPKYNIIARLVLKSYIKTKKPAY